MHKKNKLKQIMDWKAATWAGFASGIVFFLISIFIVPILLGGNMWVIIRLFASVFMGENILAPPAEYDLTALIIAIITTLILSLGYSYLISFILHQFGLLVGIVGGAFLGGAIYLINFYSLSYFYPWFFALESWPFVVTHILFGAISGGVYELLEVEKFERIK